MIAYDLMSLFRLFVLQEKTKKNTFHTALPNFAFGAYFERAGDTLKLKIALTKKRRKWFIGRWDYPHKSKPQNPYRIIWDDTVLNEISCQLEIKGVIVKRGTIVDANIDKNALCSHFCRGLKIGD